MAKLTLLGFYNHLNGTGEELFDFLTVPETIDKDLLIDNILLQCDGFEVYYSNPYFMRDAIGVWSRKWERTFTRWVKALSLEYNPLENYDRMEEWTDTDKGSADTTTENESKTSAFDSSAYQPQDKSEGTANTESENEHKHTGRLHGNVGVTTSQQMLESELNISKFNIIEEITNIFMKEFIIPIY